MESDKRELAVVSDGRMQRGRISPLYSPSIIALARENLKKRRAAEAPAKLQSLSDEEESRRAQLSAEIDRALECPCNIQESMVHCIATKRNAIIEEVRNGFAGNGINSAGQKEVVAMIINGIVWEWVRGSCSVELPSVKSREREKSHISTQYDALVEHGLKYLLEQCAAYVEENLGDCVGMLESRPALHDNDTEGVYKKLFPYDGPDGHDRNIKAFSRMAKDFYFHLADVDLQAIPEQSGRREEISYGVVVRMMVDFLNKIFGISKEMANLAGVSFYLGTRYASIAGEDENEKINTADEKEVSRLLDKIIASLLPCVGGLADDSTAEMVGAILEEYTFDVGEDEDVKHPIIPDISELKTLSRALELHIQQLSVRGKIDRVLQFSLLGDADTAIRFARQYRETFSRWSPELYFQRLWEFEIFPSKEYLLKQVANERNKLGSKAEVEALYLAFEFCQKCFDAGVMLEQNGVTKKQREQGGMMMELCRIIAGEMHEFAVLVELKLQMEDVDISGLTEMLMALEDMVKNMQTPEAFFAEIEKSIRVAEETNSVGTSGS